MRENWLGWLGRVQQIPVSALVPKVKVSRLRVMLVAEGDQI